MAAPSECAPYRVEHRPRPILSAQRQRATQRPYFIRFYRHHRSACTMTAHGIRCLSDSLVKLNRRRRIEYFIRKKIKMKYNFLHFQNGVSRPALVLSDVFHFSFLFCPHSILVCVRPWANANRGIRKSVASMVLSDESSATHDSRPMLMAIYSFTVRAIEATMEFENRFYRRMQFRKRSPG